MKNQDDTELQNRYEVWCDKVKSILDKNNFAEEKIHEIRVKMHYTENEYSENDTRKSIVKALKSTIRSLEEADIIIDRNEISEKTAITLTERILNHFPLFYKMLFQNSVHKKGTLKQENLLQIKIGNEYDLQRIVYALLLSVFPTARQEVVNDNGYGGMRADIYLEEHDIVIELKCTHESMTEKKLLEEMGADGFHYKAETIFFFVYDKFDIIKNPEAFEKAFMRSRKEDGKMVKAIILKNL